eukprot:7380373-Prymnesium_polylepis.1
MARVCFPMLSRAELDAIAVPAVPCVPQDFVHEARAYAAHGPHGASVPAQRLLRDPSVGLGGYVVEGAGVEACNGLFLQQGEADGVPQYSRGGLRMLRYQVPTARSEPQLLGYLGYS